MATATTPRYPLPPTASKASCSDGVDNDCDGLVDADEDDCADFLGDDDDSSGDGDLNIPPPGEATDCSCSAGSRVSAGGSALGLLFGLSLFLRRRRG